MPDFYSRFTGDIVLSGVTTAAMQRAIDNAVTRGETLADMDLMTEGHVSSLRFKDADLGGMVAERVAFEECYFTNVSFDKALLHGASFRGCFFENVTMRNSKFGNVTLERCTGTNLVFTETAMAELTLNNSTITNLKTNGSNLSGLRLENSTLPGCDSVITHPQFGDRGSYRTIYNSFIYRTPRRTTNPAHTHDIAVRIRGRSVWLRNATADYFAQTVGSSEERSKAAEARNLLLEKAKEAGWMADMADIAAI